MSGPIITIDGPSGSGKSTISRLLADRLGYVYLDTGAMYRAVGLKAAKSGLDLDDPASLEVLLADLDLQLLPGSADTVVMMDGRDVSLEIRSAAMGMMASKVSAYGPVRAKMTALQQHMARNGEVVAEGRDTGTIVFPGARHKFYLNASAPERAKRRTAQLHELGMTANYQEILAQIEKRDHDDSARTLAPLRAAADAVWIDCTKMDIPAVLQFMLDKIREET
ncbi:MAG: (d)CMP kinase [Deltaproteobacteria bacterium]|nr:(d)CMP kinase [Deltaproteobacteria bacterium]